MWNPSTFLFTTILNMVLLLLTLFHDSQCIPDRNAIRSDLAALNLVCRGRDSCSDNRTSDSIVDYNCHCGSFCRDLDTCCLDSPFRPSWRQQPRFAVAKCLAVYGRQIFMVDECKKGWRDDDEGFVRDMCSSSGQDRDDPFLAVPVTSLRTGITYKNYYCAVCNENPRGRQVAFWNVEVRTFLQVELDVRSETQTLSNITYRDLKYDSTEYSWTMESDVGTIPVTLDMKVPENAMQKVKTCRSPGQVSACSPDWTDRSTAEKCSAYTALVSTKPNGKMYKNPHCAICNFEQANALDCEDTEVPFPELELSRRTFFVGLFILEDEETKSKCNGEMVYDALAKKCRRVRCPRNHILRNRKCVRNRP